MKKTIEYKGYKIEAVIKGSEELVFEEVYVDDILRHNSFLKSNRSLDGILEDFKSRIDQFPEFFQFCGYAGAIKHWENKLREAVDVLDIVEAQNKLLEIREKSKSKKISPESIGDKMRAWKNRFKDESALAQRTGMSDIKSCDNSRLVHADVIKKWAETETQELNLSNFDGCLNNIESKEPEEKVKISSWLSTTAIEKFEKLVKERAKMFDGSAQERLEEVHLSGMWTNFEKGMKDKYRIGYDPAKDISTTTYMECRNPYFVETKVKDGKVSHKLTWPTCPPGPNSIEKGKPVFTEIKFCSQSVYGPVETKVGLQKLSIKENSKISNLGWEDFINFGVNYELSNKLKFPGRIQKLLDKCRDLTLKTGETMDKEHYDTVLARITTAARKMQYNQNPEKGELEALERKVENLTKEMDSNMGLKKNKRFKTNIYIFNRLSGKGHWWENGKKYIEDASKFDRPLNEGEKKQLDHMYKFWREFLFGGIK